jgi:hypothetical protein
MMPKRMPAWRRYLRFWGSNPPGDVDDELRFHLEMRVAEYIARGMLPDAARQRAAQRFGSVDRAREECVVIDEAHARSEGRAESIGARARVRSRKWPRSGKAAFRSCFRRRSVASAEK